MKVVKIIYLIGVYILCGVILWGINNTKNIAERDATLNAVNGGEVEHITRQNLKEQNIQLFGYLGTTLFLFANTYFIFRPKTNNENK